MSWYLMKRGWMDHPVFKDEPFTQREAWEWLIANALYADSIISIAGHPVPLNRGQLSYSNSFLAKAWKWDSERVRRLLKRFATWGMIALNIEAGQSIITICNYERYQSPQSISEAETWQDRGSNKGTSKGNKKEGKRIKEQKEELSPDIPLAFEAYNSMAEKNDLPVCQLHSTHRIQALRARLMECGGLNGWKSALEITAASDFLTGRKTDFKANIDFILQKPNFIKIMEGNYNKHP